MSLKSLIIDDEKLSRDLLRNLLTEYCSETEVIGEAADVDSALSQIREHDPDIVFLDIEMPGANGFELLKGMAGQNSFQTVFVTAYNQYAIQALRAGAIDYLLKPLDIDELKNTVKKLSKLACKNNPASDKEKDIPEQTILLPHLKGIKIIRLKEIVRLEADNNYTVIYLADGTVFVASKPLKELEHKLSPPWFFKTHRSHIINFHYCREYSSNEGEHVVMFNGDKVAISRLRTDAFFSALQGLNKQ
jgi:two-component system LytT family response regulator